MRARKNAPGATAWTKFELLMWKNFLNQWRHKGQTIAELLIPVVTMTLILVLRSQIDPIVMDVTRYPPVPSTTLSYSQRILTQMNISKISLGYSPRSPILEDVVTNAGANLFSRNYNDLVPILGVILPGVDILNTEREVIHEMLRNVLTIRAFENSAEVRGIYINEEATREILAVVEFDDSLSGATTLPQHLSYALRFPEKPRMNSFVGRGPGSWRTSTLFPAFEIAGPRAPNDANGGLDPGYVTEMFLALQHMVSLELINRVTGEDFTDFEFNIQRYPYPAYVLDFATEALQFLFPMFMMLSFCYTAVNIVRAITLEKELQLKEAMKIMGLPTWLHWTAWFCKQFIYLIIASVLIMIILKVPFFTAEDGSGFAVFTNTPWSVLFFFMLLYLACTIFFCFMLSGFFYKASTAALFTGVIWFVTYIPAFLLALDVTISIPAQIITCLSINSAMSYGVQLIIAGESTGGLQWGQFMSSSATDSPRLVFGEVLIMLAVNCVLYMLIALYFEQVLPGPYGTPKPWYFLVQKDFWCENKNNKMDDSTVHVVDDDEEDNIVREDDPTDLPIGVKIKNLTKIYGSNKAVNNLNLNIYDNQISVLLGHNGAGKSTTISMMTGNLAITSGSVTIAGYDITRQTRFGRSNLGFCPQHNVLFESMTVKEHLKFFARLKGFEGQELEDEIQTMITKLELVEKSDYQSQGLSGGQKRRLSVGIALCGGAKVVLLDEPTSGMDPASRRALWDLLQKEKKGRSMILTTHFMDEADILGDRVAIMADGQLQCVGSPYFLKRHYGVGYILVVVKKEGFRTFACTELIRKYIPSVIIKEDRGTEISYVLKSEYASLFETLLRDLEDNRANIQFGNYGLIATTLEDVFMSVGSDVHAKLNESLPATPQVYNGDISPFNFQPKTEASNFEYKEVTGIRLIWQQILAIWMKLGLVWIKSWPLLALQLLIPLMQLVLSLAVLEYIASFQESIVRKELTLTTGYTSTETVLSFNGTSNTSPGFLVKQAYESIYRASGVTSMELTLVDGRTLDEYYLDRLQDITTVTVDRNRLLIGATIDDNSATAWFSNFGYHDVANTMTAIHAAMLKAYAPQAEITVFNHPIDTNYEEDSDLNLLVSLLSTQLASSIGISLGIVSAVFIMFYIKERVSRAKLLQKAAGIGPAVMWCSAAVFDWLWFCLITVTVIIACVAFQVIGLSSVEELGRVYLCMMIYGAGMLPINYVFSYFFNGPSVGFVVMFFANVLFGMMGAQMVEVMWTPGLRTHTVADVLDAILQFFPLYGLVTNVRLLSQIGIIEWTCKQNCDYLASIMPNMGECTMEVLCENISEQCCLPEDPWWGWDDPGVVRYMTTTLITMVIMWAILMIAEYRLVQKVFNRQRKPPPLNYSNVDEDVKDEMNHVERIGTGKGQSLVAKGLTKYYGNHLAVNQVSFTVSDTECFGLLGVNGAGKTTTFKMLMGDELISSGDAFVAGHSVKTNITQVYENIGYCPQFDAVFGELTGRETLRLFSMLRGLSQDNAKLEAEVLAESLGFIKHLDKRVEHYSGGNKRKLSTAVALLGKTRLVFVDEPTTGVDPAAKRQVWNAIQEARRNHRGVVLTSHSMEECEALCSRLTIMANGRFQCLGTPQHLKNKFSQGFTLIIKLKHAKDSINIVSVEAVNAVKHYVANNFRNVNIMEEYQGLIKYYLPDKTMPWSRMFGIMENAKQELEIEDYSISQTTLEQIFLQFNKYQRLGFSLNGDIAVDSTGEGDILVQQQPVVPVTRL